MIDVKIRKKLFGPNGDMLLDLDFQINEGQILTLYGPSGAGKTTTLRILSGLLKAETGKISVNNTIWYDSSQKINLAPQKRNAAYVFQDYALFPNMTVFENLQFAAGDKKNRKAIAEIIEITGLGDLQFRRPQTLSGGQQQRVALARAIAQQPQILLLDEPLAALDYKIRQSLQEYILQIHKKYNLTTILVSHDIGEIYRLSDIVIELDHGKIVRQGSPSQLFAGQDISGKFKFAGEILDIISQEVVNIITVLIQNQIVKVIVDSAEHQDLQVGDKVIVASKAFNPVIYKI